MIFMEGSRKAYRKTALRQLDLFDNPQDKFRLPNEVVSEWVMDTVRDLPPVNDSYEARFVLRKLREIGYTVELNDLSEETAFLAWKAAQRHISDASARLKRPYID